MEISIERSLQHWCPNEGSNSEPFDHKNDGVTAQPQHNKTKDWALNYITIIMIHLKFYVLVELTLFNFSFCIVLAANFTFTINKIILSSAINIIQSKRFDSSLLKKLYLTLESNLFLCSLFRIIGYQSWRYYQGSLLDLYLPYVNMYTLYRFWSKY